MGRRFMRPIIALAALQLLVGTALAQQASTKSDPPAGPGPQGQIEQTAQKQVSGMVLRSKDVQIRQQGQETGQHNRVVLLATQEGERLVVDLGPTQNLQDLSVQQGMQLDAQGQVVRIGDRPVLFAKQVTALGKTFQIQRPEQRQPQQIADQIQRPEQWQPQQITGQIQRMKDVELRGTDRTHKVALLATEHGRQFVVDLGPTQQLHNMRLQQGTQVQVQGRPARIGDRLVLLAHQVTVNNQTVQINRPQAQMAQQHRPRQQMAAQQFHAQRPSMINVTAASNIVGRIVVDRQGREIGDVDYLVIDAQSGKVRYALLGEGGFLGMGEDLIPIPWSALEFGPQTLTLNKSLAELRNAPRYSADRLLELTEPDVDRRIIHYYLTPQGQGQQETQQPQAQGQQETQQQTTAVQPYVLVDRDVVAIVTPPPFITAEQIRGVEVVGPSGEEVGEIDEVMIDRDHGQVAYVLLERGGFLGFGEEWLPVPFEAFRVSGGDFTLTMPEAQLRPMRQIPRENFPTRVSAEHLRQLYTQYNVTPYWERTASAAGSAGQQGASIAATVQELDKQQGTLTLQTASGKTVELQVSRELLSTLQAGDRVEVVIRQMSEGQPSGMRRLSPSQPEQGR